MSWKLYLEHMIFREVIFEFQEVCPVWEVRCAHLASLPWVCVAEVQSRGEVLGLELSNPEPSSPTWAGGFWEPSDHEINFQGFAFFFFFPG